MADTKNTFVATSASLLLIGALTACTGGTGPDVFQPVVAREPTENQRETPNAPQQGSGGVAIPGDGDDDDGNGGGGGNGGGNGNGGGEPPTTAASCATLRGCCGSLPAQATEGCNSVASGGTEKNCADLIAALQNANYCK